MDTIVSRAWDVLGPLVGAHVDKAPGQFKQVVREALETEGLALSPGGHNLVYVPDSHDSIMSIRVECYDPITAQYQWIHIDWSWHH